MNIHEIITGKADATKPAAETEPKDQVEQPAEKVATEEPKGRTVKFNKEPRFIPEEMVDTLVQKGLHHDTVQEKLIQAQASLTRAARVNGFDRVDDYIASLDTKEKEAVQSSIEDAYGDPDKMDAAIRQHPLVKQAAELATQVAREKAKASLKGQPFFSDLEPEFDKVLDANPGVDPDIAYDFLIGKLVREGKMDELVAKAKAEAKKQANADLEDKSRRGSPKGSASAQETPTLGERGRMIANIFGVDPTKVAQRMKK